MVVYPASGVYGTDLAYYPLGQYNLAPGPRPIRGGAVRSDKGRGAAGRSSYLGYSAGKATYGRYYSKNNLERPPETNGTSPIDIPYQTAPNIGEAVLPATVYKPNPGVTAIAGQNIPQYAASVAQAVPQIIPTVQPTVLTQKSSETVLEEVCQRHMWGAPSYQLLTTNGPENRPLYLYKITIPALTSVIPYFQVIYLQNVVIVS